MQEELVNEWLWMETLDEITRSQAVLALGAGLPMKGTDEPV